MSDSDDPQKIKRTKAAEAYIGKDVLGFLERNTTLSPHMLLVTAPDCDYTDMNIVQRMLKRHDLHEAFQRSGLGYYADDEPICHKLEKKGSYHAHVGEEGSLNPYDNPDSVFALAITSIETPQLIFAKLSNIPNPEAIGTIPGTVHDWRAAILFHEASHHIGRHINNPLDQWQEHDADSGAFKLYQKAYSEGFVTSPDVPEAMRAARAINTMTQSFNPDLRYSLTSLAPIHPQDHLGIDASEDAETLESAKSRIHQKIGETLGTDETAGRSAALDQPELVYETARKMLIKGDFSDNQTQQTFVRNFVEGAEKYAAPYFKTGGRITSFDMLPSDNIDQPRIPQIDNNNDSIRSKQSQTLQTQGP